MNKEKIAIMFSGQGTQFVGMMKSFHDECPESKLIFDKANKLLGRDISKICFEGPLEQLDLTHNTQPALLICEVAIFEALKNAGIKADAVAGFSLGEYSALVAAEILEFDDAIRIVQIRADAMQEAVPVGEGGMVVLESSDRDFILDLCNQCDGYVEPANWNCPKQTVVSGEAKAVNEFRKLSKKMGVRALPLHVSAPFHCKMMEPVSEILQTEFNKVQLSEPVVPIYMNIDSKPTTNRKIIKRNIIDQAKSPVLWEQTIRNMYEDGIRMFVELGPEQVLVKTVEKTLTDESDFHTFSVQDISQLNELIILFED